MIKKFLIAAAIVISVGAMFTGCTKNYVTQTTGGGVVPYTVVDTLTQSSWSYDSTNEVYYVSLQDSSLTPDITDDGAVFIYISLDGGNSYELLPSMYNNGYDFIGIAGDYGFTIDAVPNQGSTTAPNFQITVKEINFPSNLQSQMTGVDFKDYNAVAKAFDLKN